MVADPERRHTEHASQKIGGKICADLDAGRFAAEGPYRSPDRSVARCAGKTHEPAPIVEYAMSIGNPSIAEVLGRMRQHGCERILVLPLYPQYAASSTASAFDEVFAQLGRCVIPPHYVL